MQLWYFSDQSMSGERYEFSDTWFARSLGVGLGTIFTQFVARREKVVNSIQGNDCVVL